MKDYRFSSVLSESIVRGILKGYKEYLKERRQKKEKMKISSAYAWVKGNHIEDAVANECLPLGIEYNTSKAGYTWGYLQFVNNNDNTLFIIKNSSSLYKTVGLSNNRQIEENNYLVELSQINVGLNFEEIDNYNNATQDSYQLSLFDPILAIDKEQAEVEISELKKKFHRFYIITYSLDEAKMISEINLLLPAPGLNKMYLIEDWTYLIERVGIDISEEDLAAVKNEKEPERQVAYGDYGIEIPVERRVIQDE